MAKKTLTQQLAEAKEENENLRKVVRHALECAEEDGILADICETGVAAVDAVRKAVGMPVCIRVEQLLISPETDYFSIPADLIQPGGTMALGDVLDFLGGDFEVGIQEY